MQVVSIGAVLAGCGGGYQQLTRNEAKQLLGNGHPKILRIETVRDVGGNRLVVATLEGHFNPVLASCGLGPCRPSPRISYVWLSFSLPRDMSGFGTTSAAQLAAINNARNAKSVFGIFPDFTNPAIRCAIPRGNASGTIPGACITLAHARSIEFRERWPFAPTRDGHWPHNEKTGGWIVTLDRACNTRDATACSAPSGRSWARNEEFPVPL